jgi:hypothetical protein
VTSTFLGCFGGGGGLVIPEVAVTQPLASTFLGAENLGPGFCIRTVLSVPRKGTVYSFTSVVDGTGVAGEATATIC